MATKAGSDVAFAIATRKTKAGASARSIDGLSNRISIPEYASKHFQQWLPVVGQFGNAKTRDRLYDWGSLIMGVRRRRTHPWILEVTGHNSRGCH